MNQIHLIITVIGLLAGLNVNCVNSLDRTTDDPKVLVIFCRLLYFSGKLVSRSDQALGHRCFNETFSSSVRQHIFQCYGDLLTKQMPIIRKICAEMKGYQTMPINQVKTCLNKAFDASLLQVFDSCIEDDERERNQKFESLFIS